MQRRGWKVFTICLLLLLVRPTKSVFLCFTFWKDASGWKAKPANDRKAKLVQKTREILCRKRAAARPIGVTFVRLNQLMRGWINYFGIGSMNPVLWLLFIFSLFGFRNNSLDHSCYQRAELSGVLFSDHRLSGLSLQRLSRYIGDFAAAVRDSHTL